LQETREASAKSLDFRITCSKLAAMEVDQLEHDSDACLSFTDSWATKILTLFSLYRL